jgi:hypothetical protein
VILSFRQLRAYTDDANLLGDNTDTTKKITDIFIDANKEVGPEVNAKREQSVCCCPVTRVQVKIRTL